MVPSPRESAPIARAAVRSFIVPYRPRHSMTGLPHEQGAGNLAPHGLDLLAAYPGGLEAGHEHLEPIGRGWIAALAQIRAEDEVLRSHALDARRGVGEGHAGRMPHPFERGVRSHEDAKRAQLHLCAKGRYLLHLRL